MSEPKSTGNGASDPVDADDVTDLHELNDALKAGFRRAGVHWMRAGYEVLAGLGALLDEIASAGNDDEVSQADAGPQKIQLD